MHFSQFQVEWTKASRSNPFNDSRYYKNSNLTMFKTFVLSNL